MRILNALLVACLLAVGVAACDDTIRGVGRDVNDSADAVSDSVD